MDGISHLHNGHHTYRPSRHHHISLLSSALMLTMFMEWGIWSAVAVMLGVTTLMEVLWLRRWGRKVMAGGNGNEWETWRRMIGVGKSCVGPEATYVFTVSVCVEGLPTFDSWLI
jgi:hypothetical protein